MLHCRPSTLLYIVGALTIGSCLLYALQLRLELDQVREARVWTFGEPSKLDNGPTQQPKETGNSALSTLTNSYYRQMYLPESSPIDLTTLETVCSEIHFSADLYLDCVALFGGITTVMSQLKTCFRIAIETGTHLVMPVISERDDADITVLHEEQASLTDLDSYKSPNKVDYGHFFDSGHLIRQFRQSCPQLQIISRNGAKEPEKIFGRRIAIHLEQAPGYSLGPYAGRTDHDWKSWFQQAIRTTINQTDVSTTALDPHSEDLDDGIATSIATFSPMTFFDITANASGRSLALWNDLGFVFRTLPDPRTLHAHLQSSIASQKGPYFGVHFRVEQDAIQGGFDSINLQIDTILQTIEEAWTAYRYNDTSAEKLIYLACGDASKSDIFGERVKSLGWRVVDKYKLIETSSSTKDQGKLLGSMNFDQLGMVDLGMMIKSDFFVGVANSAFSYTIAHARSESGRYRGGSLRNWADESMRNGRSQLSHDSNEVYHCCL